MKRLRILGAFFLLIVVLVSLGFVSALNSCDSAQTILNLSGSQNAHASFYNGDANYPYAICFNERFLTAYSGATPHSCTNTNGVIGLSSLTNAHVENVTLTNYANDVCYGNLVCNLRVGTGGNVPCLPENGAIPAEANLFSISSLTNGHAAKLGDYMYTVCCSASGYTPITDNDGTCEPPAETADNSCDCVTAPNYHCNSRSNPSTPSETGVTSVYWANGTIVVGTLEIINNGYVNNSVYLVAYVDSSIPNGNAVTFTIYENDSNNIKQNIRVLSGNVLGGKAYVEWPINDMDINSSLPETDTPNVFEYYFVASLGSSSNSSSLLNVNNQNGPNVVPVVNITSPADDAVYFINQTVNFCSGSFDRDGRVNLSWDIGDSITESERNATCFSHNYTSGGERIITLTATDNDGASSTSRVVILIVEKGINIYAKINKPSQNEDLFNYTVYYNGSGSWVVNITDNNAAVCLGGNCPLKAGCPPSFTGTCPIDVDVSNGKKGNYADMFFNWTYGGDVFLIKSHAGFAMVTGNRTYSGAGMNKIINLTITAFNDTSNVYNKFNINEPTGCSADGFFLKMSDGQMVSTTSIFAPAGICSRVSPICCPRIGDYACVYNSGIGGNICQANSCNGFFSAPGGTTAAITLCNHYNNVTGDKQVQCNADCARAGASSQQLDFIRNTYGLGGNYQINNVRCVWTTTTAGGRCDVDYTSYEINTNVVPPAETSSGCIEQIISESECTPDNYQVVTWNSSAINPSNAADAARCNNQSTQTVLCGTPVIALPFFTLGNFIVAVIIIVLIYIILINSKKERNVKEKKGKSLKGKKRK